MSAPECTKVIDGQLCRLVSPRPSSIAHFLMDSFRIGRGGDLAFVLCPTAPACNLTAMRSWVVEQLIDIENHRADNTLMVELELRLWDHLSRFQNTEALLNLDIPTDMARHLKMPLPYWEPTPATVTCDPQKRRPRDWTKHSSPNSMASHTAPCTNPHTDTTHTAEKSNVQID